MYYFRIPYGKPFFFFFLSFGSCNILLDRYYLYPNGSIRNTCLICCMYVKTLQTHLLEYTSCSALSSVLPQDDRTTIKN